MASDVKQEEEPERSQGKVDKNKKTKEVPEKRPHPGNTQAVDKTFDQAWSITNANGSIRFRSNWTIVML